MKQLKTQEERQHIAQNIHANLIDKLNLPTSFQGIQEFIKVLEAYKEHKVPKGLNGQITVSEISRVIDYHLPLKKQAEPIVKLVILEKACKKI